MAIEIQPDEQNLYSTTDLKFAAFLRVIGRSGRAQLVYKGATRIPGRQNLCRFYFLIDPSLRSDLERDYDNDAEVSARQVLLEYETLKKSAFTAPEAHGIGGDFTTNGPPST